MKRFLILLAMIILAGLLVVGCDEDDEDNPLTPGDLEDVNFEMFMSEFEDTDEIHPRLLGTLLMLIDDIAQREGPSRKIADGPDTILYHPDSKYWYCVIEDFDYDDSTTLRFVDSIQFLQDGVPVQFPGDSVNLGYGYMRMTASGPHITTGTVWQNLVLTPEGADSDTLWISGTGGITAIYDMQEIVVNDTTNCDADIDMAFTYTNLLIDMTGFGESAEIGCPRSGSIVAAGDFDVACTGAGEGAVGGTWTVTEIFNDGTIAYTVSNGLLQWTFTETCD